MFEGGYAWFPMFLPDRKGEYKAKYSIEFLSTTTRAMADVGLGVAIKHAVLVETIAKFPVMLFGVGEHAE